MRRDFSENAKTTLFNLIDQINGEQWFGWTDAIGDFFCWGLNIENYLNDLDSYHKKVMDKNDTTKEQIQQIFDDVNLVDSSYQSIFNQCSQAVTEQIDYIRGLSDCINPLKSNFNISSINLIMNSIDLSFIKDNPFIQAYGFNYEQYVLLKYTFDRLEKNYTGDTNSKEYINYVFTTIYPLCNNYDAFRFRCTTNGIKSSEAIQRLKKAGLTEQDIADLIIIINVQHGLSVESIQAEGVDLSVSKYKDITQNDFKVISSLYSDEVEKDFAHELIQFAAFSAKDSFFRNCVDLFNFGLTNYEISFKGDIDSTRVDYSDLASDVDAINIYERLEGNSNIFEIYYNYNKGLHDGSVNRATEFFENLGDGDVGIGIMELDRILNEKTPGSEYIKPSNQQDLVEEKEKEFWQWLLQQYEKEKNNESKIRKE